MDCINELFKLAGLTEDVAYAGSRVDYERPSLSAVGSGEGAQSHGWGLYYALEPAVADAYRQAFTADKYLQQVRIGGQDGRAFLGDLFNQETKYKFDNVFRRWQATTPEKLKNNLLTALTDVQTYYQNLFKTGHKSLFNQDEEPYHNPDDKRLADEAAKKRDFVASLPQDEFEVAAKGITVKAEIPDLKFMLDEQEKIINQNDYIRSRIAELVSELDWDYTATSYYDSRSFYAVLSEHAGSDKEASKLLYKHGIMGIRYVGQQDGECVVIFNDKDVSILKKFYNGDGIDMERIK